MDSTIVILMITSILVSALFGYLIGRKTVKLCKHIGEKRAIKDAYKVIHGEKENNIEIDGKIIPAKEFIVRDNNDVDVKITLSDPTIHKNIQKNGQLQ